MPISEWTYKSDGAVRHLGPMSQDFHRSFGLGSSDKSISTLDSSGVALAAIQGLHQTVQAKDKKIAELSRALQQQSKQCKQQADLAAKQSELIAELAERLEQLESLVAPTN